MLDLRKKVKKDFFNEDVNLSDITWLEKGSAPHQHIEHMRESLDRHFLKKHSEKSLERFRGFGLKQQEALSI